VRNYLIPIIFAVTISLALGYQDASAMTIIFDNGAPNGNVRCSNNIVTCGSPFTTVSTETITDIHFWITEIPGPFDQNVNWAIYADAGGVLQTPAIASGIGTTVMTNPFLLPSPSGHCDSTPSFGSTGCLEVWMDLDSPVNNLPAGTYWFTIENPNGLWQVLIHSGPIVPGIAVCTGLACQNFGIITNFEFAFMVSALSSIVGGELSPIETTSLLLAGLQSSAMWMLPVLAGAAGVGAFYIKTRMNKE